MLRIGVFGTGHLGKIHIKCLQNVTGFDLIGFYDPDAARAKEIAEEFQLKSFESQEELLELVDVVDIVSPTLTHYDIAQKSLTWGKHVFIEKPICSNLKQALALKTLLLEKKLNLQVGHVERYNPAWIAAKPFFNKPLFIEGHRLAPFNPRGTDVSVVEDLMIHDLDLVIQAVNSPVKEVHANGVSILSDQADICNARIQFENGAVANLTASRISVKQMRKLRVFQSDAYISMDFMERNTEIIRLLGEDDTGLNEDGVFEIPIQGKSKKIQIIQAERKEVNAIEEELRSFYQSIINNTVPEVSIDSGIKALELAEQILEKLKTN